MELVYIIRNRLEFLDLKTSEKIAHVAGGFFGDRGKKWENAREATGRTEGGNKKLSFPLAKQTPSNEG